MRTSEVLNIAADMIEVRGWGQGFEKSPHRIEDPWGLESSDGPICLEGGIIAAMGLKQGPAGNEEDVVRACPAYQAVLSYLGDYYKEISIPNCRTLYTYNDSPTRTAEEVIATLRAAAVIEQAREEALETVSA